MLFAAAPVSPAVASGCCELAAQLATELSGAIIKLADWCQLDSDLTSHGVSLSCLSVDTDRHQTGTEHSASRTRRCLMFEDKGDKLQRWFTAALNRTMTRGERRHSRRGQEKHEASAGEYSRNIFTSYSADLGVCFNQIRNDCGKTNQDCFGEFYVKFKWVKERIELVMLP